MGNPKIWRVALTGAGLALGIWLFFRFLGPVLLPFSAGLVIAAAAEPAVSRLQSRFHLPRWLCAGIGVTMIYVLLSLVVFILFRLLWRELTAFVRALPGLVQSLSDPAENLKQWLLGLADRFPNGIGKVLQDSITEFFRSGAGLAGRVYDWAFSAVTGLLKRIPDLALFVLTAVLSGFMLASELPQLRALWQRKAPEQWQQRIRTVLHRLKTTLGGWLQAQAKLMLISALLLTVGFLLLGVDYPLLFGLVIALVDALPALGTGLILIPWGLFMYLQGNSFLGTGLLCLYGVAALLRTALEPKLLGRQIGMSPLLTLLALYAGYRFAGILGMILFPIAAIMGKQLLELTADN